MTAHHHFASYLLGLRTGQTAFWMHPNEEYTPVLAKRMLLRLGLAWQGFVQSLDIANPNRTTRPLRDLDKLVARIPAPLVEVPYTTRTTAFQLIELWQESLANCIGSLPPASGVKMWFQTAEQMLKLQANEKSELKSKRENKKSKLKTESTNKKSEFKPEDWVLLDQKTHELIRKCGESLDSFFPASAWSQDEQRGKEWQELHPDYWIWDVLEAGVKRLNSSLPLPTSLEGDNSTLARNAKIYELAQHSDNTWKLIGKKIQLEFGEELTDQGLQKAAAAYARVKSLPSIPKRKAGRRKD